MHKLFNHKISFGIFYSVWTESSTLDMSLLIRQVEDKINERLSTTDSFVILIFMFRSYLTPNLQKKNISRKIYRTI